MKTKAPQTHIQAAILAANKQFITVFNQNDAAGVADHFTENARLLPAYGDLITGRGAIRAFWQGAFDMGIGTAERTTIEVAGQDEIAIEVGTYVLRGVDGRLLDQGKYLAVWKQEDGQWKCHRHIWNGRLPLQGSSEGC